MVVNTNQTHSHHYKEVLTDTSHKIYKKTCSILRGKVFTPSCDALKAARKQLKSEGKGNKSNATEALAPADVEQHLETLILLHCNKPYGGKSLHTWEPEDETSITNYGLVISL